MNLTRRLSLFVSLVFAVTMLAAAHADEDATDPDVTALVPNGKLLEGGILVGGQPTEDALAGLADAGYASVLNLRGGEESSIRGEEVERFGLEYFELPIEGAAGLTEESAREFARLLDELPRPTLVHCGSGNRVGGLFALEAHFVDGRSGAEALEIGLESGLTSLEGVVRERLGLTED